MTEHKYGMPFDGTADGIEAQLVPCNSEVSMAIYSLSSVFVFEKTGIKKLNSALI